MKKLLLATTVVVLLAVGGSIAWATIPDSSGVVHACYKKNGDLRVIDPSASKADQSQCKHDETALDLLSTSYAPQYAYAQIYVQRGSGAPTVWASYSTALGSPVGDNTGGVFRFTCRSSDVTCTVTVAASGPTGTTVFPRLLIHKQELSGGPSTYCEYLDGATNSDPWEPVGPSLTMGIGGTQDCPGHTGPGGVVSAYTVAPGYYDVWSTFTFMQPS
jgi:hypothetical protein